MLGRDSFGRDNCGSDNLGNDNAPVVLDTVKKLGLELKYILLTHGHFDHFLAVPGIREAFPNVPVYIHRADASDDAGAQHLKLPATEGRVFWDEGDTLMLGSLTIEVLYTPGHSKGSVTLRVGSALFTGDTLFRSSMGRTDLEGGSYQEIMASLKRLAQLPGDYQVYPGHEGATTLDRERRSNYYMQEAMDG
ncbi:MAG: MBL fold metallo-hydrolase [Clostridia bacterium]|nr:MBL fold metallo-hydrolase [Clostridia bacterium]